MSEISNNCHGNSLKINETNVGETDGEIMDKISKMRIELNEKITENENYRQEIHELRHKLKACVATQKHLSDVNESMEENLASERTAWDRKMNNLVEKFAADKKQLQDRISELQTSLSNEEKKGEDLRETLAAKEKIIDAIKSKEPDKSQEIWMLKEKINVLIHDLEEKEKVEEELLSKQQKLQETIVTLEKNYNEVRDILRVKTMDFESLNDILETTKDELVLCRSELESLKAIPACDSAKGNSLFAEVEDSRRQLISDISSLQQKYLRMKQTYGAKENQIRVLKAEKAALLRKLEDDNVEAIDRSTRLLETYKLRISELENKLKVEEKKLRMSDKNKEQPADNNFSYLQSLLTAKKKEVQELITKLDESSTQNILREEMKYEIEKQLRKWRYKAMSYEAQLLAAQNLAKCKNCQQGMEPNDSGDALNTKQLDRKWTKTTTPYLPETHNLETPLGELLKIPNFSRENAKKCRDIKDHLAATKASDKPEENIKSLEVEEMIDVDESFPASPASPSSIKSISDHESNKENNAGASNANDVSLKSAFAKSAEKTSGLRGEEKTKKSLRFTADTNDSEKPKLTRQKKEKKAYPVVFI